jgi:gas vesicle protein
MIGLGVGGVVAAPVLLAVAGVAGVLTVGRAFRQERRKALSAERQRVKDEYHDYLDEVQVRFAKALDDAVRSVQRQLRDGASTRLAELQRSTRSALEATERAATVDDAARASGVLELTRELEAVAALRVQVRSEVRATLQALPGSPGERSTDG